MKTVQDLEVELAEALKVWEAARDLAWTTRAASPEADAAVAAWEKAWDATARANAIWYELNKAREKQR